MGVDIMAAMTGFGAFFQSRKIGGARTDNMSLRLQYSYTTGILFFATILLSIGLFKEEITCVDVHENAAPKTATQYCWVSGTYTVPGKEAKYHQGIVKEDDECCLPNGDIKKGEEACFSQSKRVWIKEAGQQGDNTGKKDPKCKKKQNYYMWVPYILMAEGLLFLLPNKLWEMFEEGKMESISDGIRISQKKNEEKSTESTIKNIANFLQGERSDGSQHMKYAVGWIIVQCFCFINVIINWVLLDNFTNGNFSNLGWRWLDSESEKRDEILNSVFPRMSACTWKTYGAGGHIQQQNFLCILGANIVTQKVFLFLWFWYFVLFATSFVSMLYSFLIFFSNRFGIRQYFLMFAEKSKNAKIDKKKSEVRSYLRNLDRYRFYFVYFLAYNVDSQKLHEILEQAANVHPPTYNQSRQNVRQASVISSTPSLRGPEKNRRGVDVGVLSTGQTKKLKLVGEETNKSSPKEKFNLH